MSLRAVRAVGNAVIAVVTSVVVAVSMDVVIVRISHVPSVLRSRMNRV